MKILGLDIKLADRKALSREDILGELADAGAGGLGGFLSKSGARVDYKTALQVTTAFACARVIAEGIAQVPFKLYQATDGVKRPASEHPAYNLIALKPNDWQTSYEMREQIGLHLAFCNQAFVWKNMFRGKLLELLPFEPQQVRMERKAWKTRYWVRIDDKSEQEIPASEMWHIRGPSWNGWQGLDGIKLAREALGLALATEEHSARQFRNGARLGGILTTDKDLTKEQREALRDSWAETHAGTGNAYKTGILWGGLKWLTTAQQNGEAQLIEQRRFQVEQICSGMRVLPIMIGFSDKSVTYASAEQMFLANDVYTLGPYYSRLEQSAMVNLLTESELQSGYYMKFVAQGLMRSDNKSRGEYFAKALGAGGSPAWMSQDEVRGLEELNPMGGNAAQLREPTNVGSKAPATTDDADPKKDE